MVEKWHAPHEPVPAWLDASKEVPASTPGAPAPREPFVRASMAALLALGCTEAQAAQVVANAVNETGWGKHYGAFNLGGWKITPAYAREHPGAAWWRAPGNRSSGDPPWCYYRAFASLADFYSAWLTHFVPCPDVTPPYPGYARTGELFWTGGPWFSELILVGYKGEVTRNKLLELRRAHRPDSEHPSVRDHESIVRSVLAMWHSRPVTP